jgi:hypothetical protein
MTDPLNSRHRGHCSVLAELNHVSMQALNLKLAILDTRDVDSDTTAADHGYQTRDPVC